MNQKYFLFGVVTLFLPHTISSVIELNNEQVKEGVIIEDHDLILSGNNVLEGDDTIIRARKRDIVIKVLGKVVLEGIKNNRLFLEIDPGREVSFVGQQDGDVLTIKNIKFVWPNLENDNFTINVNTNLVFDESAKITVPNEYTLVALKDLLTIKR